MYTVHTACRRVETRPVDLRRETVWSLIHCWTTPLCAFSQWLWDSLTCVEVDTLATRKLHVKFLTRRHIQNRYERWIPVYFITVYPIPFGNKIQKLCYSNNGAEYVFGVVQQLSLLPLLLQCVVLGSVAAAAATMMMVLMIKGNRD